MFLLLMASIASAQGTRADYDRADRLGRLLRNKTFRMQLMPHWTPDGNAFWYQIDGPNGTHDFIWVDAVAGTRSAAFDDAKLATALSTALGHKCEADHLPIDAIEPGDKPTLRVINSAGKRWQIDLTTYAVTPLAGRAQAATSLQQLNRIHRSRNGGEETSITFDNQTKEPVVIYWVDPSGEQFSYGNIAPGERLDHNTFAGHVWVIKNQEGRTIAIFEATEGGSDAVISPDTIRNNGPRSPAPPATQDADIAPPMEDDTFDGGDRLINSPDGKWIAFIRNYNVFISDRASNKTFALTTNGVPADSYESNLRWSPDSKKLVALKTLDGEHREVYLVQSSPPDQLQPKLLHYDYLKPGDRIPLTKPHLFDVATRKEIAVSDSLFPNPWSLEDVRWDADSRRFTFLL